MSDRARLRQSLRNFKRLLSLEPGHLGHLERLARISAELGKPKDASKFLVERAAALSKQGAVEAALADLTAALRFDRKNKRARRLQVDLQAALQETPPPVRVERSHPPVAAPPPEPEPTPEPLAPSISLAELGSPPPLVAPPEEDEIIYDASALLAVKDDLDLVDDESTNIPAMAEPPTLDVEPDPISISGHIPTLNIEPMPEESVDDMLNEVLESGPRFEDLGDRVQDPRFEDKRTVPFAAIRHSQGLLDGGTIDLEDDDDDVAVVDMGPATGLLAPPGARIEDRDTEFGAPDGLMPEIPLFTGVAEERILHLRDICQETSAEPGETIVEEAQRYAGAYLVLTGAVAVVGSDDGNRALHVARAGDFVGLVEAFRGGPWRHDIVAREASVLLRLTTNQLADLRRRYPRIERTLTEEAERREALFLVAGSRLFRALSHDAQNMLAGHLEARHLIPGEILFTAGAPAGGLFLVADGAIAILHWGAERGRLGAGECLGVLAALTRGAAHATARAAIPTYVYGLDRTLIKPLLEDPGVQQAFERVAEVRRVTLGA